MSSLWIVLFIVAVYMIAISAISVIARKSGRTPEGFIRGGKAFPAAVIGLFLASEVIGTSASIGTAQGAYEDGLSAAWNIGALGIGFIVFALLLAKRFRRMNVTTISGALERAYGPAIRRAASVTMIASLLLVATAAYASGGAMISVLLGIEPIAAIVVVGVLASIYVAIGGMRSVIYTNLVNIAMKIVGIAIVAVFSLVAVGGMSGLVASAPAGALDWDGVGWGQIGAWLIAGGGAMFATQYVVQSISTVRNENDAARATLYTASILIPYGVVAALIGVCAAIVHPGIPSLQALPAMVIDMPPFWAGIGVTGLIASVFGLISALTISSATLLLKDFYEPYRNPGGDKRRSVRFIRFATVVCGLLPVVLAVFASDVLAVTFLAKALRAMLAVLVVLMFFAPRFGSRQAAYAAVLISLPATIGWYLAGDPFGVDNAYVAIAVPLVVMGLAQVLGTGTKPRPVDGPVRDAEPRSETRTP